MEKLRLEQKTLEETGDASKLEEIKARVDALPRREALVDFDGPVTVEAYTVAHTKGVPRIAHVACLTDDRRRTWGTVDDPPTLEAMVRDEFCGRRGRIDGRGHLSLD